MSLDCAPTQHRLLSDINIRRSTATCDSDATQPALCHLEHCAVASGGSRSLSNHQLAHKARTKVACMTEIVTDEQRTWCLGRLLRQAADGCGIALRWQRPNIVWYSIARIETMRQPVRRRGRYDQNQVAGCLREIVPRIVSLTVGLMAILELRRHQRSLNVAQQPRYSAP
jgi:hypothetical protein